MEILKKVKLELDSREPQYNIRLIFVALTAVREMNAAGMFPVLVVGSRYRELLDNDHQLLSPIDPASPFQNAMGWVGTMYGLVIWDPNVDHPRNSFRHLAEQLGPYDLGVTNVSSHSVHEQHQQS